MEAQDKYLILKIPLLLLVGVVLFSGVGAVSAASTGNSTIYVNTEGDDTWDGLSPVYNTTSGPKKTITNATGTVAINGTVYIAPGTYTESGITINKNMTITGENQKNTIINGQHSENSIFKIVQGITVNINNLTLTNNTANLIGAIYNEAGVLTVINCTFTNNTETYGGAIGNYGGSLTVINSTFTNNTASRDGGAIWSYAGDSTVTNCTLTNNTASRDGGAIWGYWGSLTVISCTFTNNTASHDGGAIWDSVTEGSKVVVHFNRIVGNSPNTSEIYSFYGIVDATLNWWGSNENPSIYVSTGTTGIVNVTSWLVLNATVNPISVMDGGNSLVTVDLLYDNGGNYHDPINGHVPDGTPVTFTATNGDVNSTSTLINGQATALFTANRAGTASINTTIDSQTLTKQLTITPAAYLYLNTTTSKKNPTAGETFILTYKLSNRGPDNATNVTVSFQIPSGLEFVSASVDNGIWTYNPANRTVTWNLTNVAVGDPYLYLTVRALGTGSYTIIPTITSETFNRNTDPLTPFTINVKAQNNSNGNTVNAASTTKTIPLQTTGMPIVGLILAILAVLGGILTPKKK
jgi:uncharacterized repeat protein (TIGR01451 family)